MNLVIVWAPRAVQDAKVLYQSYLDHWGEQAADELIAKIDRSLLLVSTYPQIFQKSYRPGTIHRIALSKNTALYFQVGDLEVRVIHLWDSRF